MVFIYSTVGRTILESSIKPFTDFIRYNSTLSWRVYPSMMEANSLSNFMSNSESVLLTRISLLCSSLGAFFFIIATSVCISSLALTNHLYPDNILFLIHVNILTMNSTIDDKIPSSPTFISASTSD